ncbi:MAG TPA: hypothetical protein VJO72_11950, partial [Candidatus Dormibacteraeota bacterium]|nr:hypothetical protein [Candidatus Dormibacteraeota bacterium]
QMLANVVRTDRHQLRPLAGDSELFGTPSEVARSLRVSGACATSASSTDTAVWMPGDRRPLA